MGQGSPTISDARERGNPYDASHHEPIQHHTPGSSVESCPHSSTTEQYIAAAAEGDSITTSPCTSSHTQPMSVELQQSFSEESETEVEETSSDQRQPRRAALRQRELMRYLIEDDLI